MVDDLRLRVAEETRGRLLLRQVVVRAARHDHLVALALEPLDEMRSEEPGAARDERLHFLPQSTRPIQPARFAAYQRIVCRTPSSHETSGFQPVSALSFS